MHTNQLAHFLFLNLEVLNLGFNTFSASCTFQFVLYVYSLCDVLESLLNPQQRIRDL